MRPFASAIRASSALRAVTAQAVLGCSILCACSVVSGCSADAASPAAATPDPGGNGPDNPSDGDPSSEDTPGTSAPTVSGAAGGPGSDPDPVTPGPSGGPGGPDVPGATGPTGPAEGPSTTPPSQGAGVDSVSNCVDPEAIGPSPIRRISAEEYTNAVRDVFGVSVNPGDLPADERLGPFIANVTSPLVRDNVDRYFYVGKKVAQAIVADFPARSGCSSVEDAACVDTFLRTAARRAFHGTLEDGDAALLAGIASDLSGSEPALVVQTQLEFILSSPKFLYLVEFGGSGTTMAPLTPGEVAGRLAAFLWRSVPDQALLDAADAGNLGTPEQVRAQALTMLADSRAIPMLESFADQWLRIGSASPDASALDQQIYAQPGAVLAQAATNPALTFNDLLTGTSAPLGSELAAMYGATVDANGMGTLPAERQGLLLSAAFLKSNASGSRPSPVKRGFVLRRSLLCETVPPPTDPVDMQIDEAGAGVTEQEAFNAHSSVAECWACHRFMDPMGDAFGQYDAQGGYDASLATQTSGTVYFRAGHEPAELAFSSAAELLSGLQADATPRQCFVLQMLRFALGRGETADDACGVESIRDAVTENMSVQELLIQIAASPQFLNRNPVVAGGSCR